MLETLRIRNMAVIESVEVEFKDGLNILSGETGAGKSIVIDAISLILGSRASSDIVRKGCDECTIEGLFDLSGLPAIQKKLSELGFKNEQGELLIKRIISQTGKHRIFINGELATLTNLQALCEGLVDICGQHEHQSLLKATAQVDLVDRHGGHTAQARKYETLFHDLQALRTKKEELEKQANERARAADFLKFQIEELRNANLAPGEDEELQKEKILLQSSQQRVSAGEATRSYLEDDSSGVLIQLKMAVNKIRALVALDPNAASILTHLEQSLAEAEEASLLVSRMMNQMDSSESRLEEIQERLALFANLRRKYGSTVDEMLAHLSRFETEHAELEGTTHQIEEISAQIQKTEKTLRTTADSLSESRKKTAKSLSKAVTQEIRELRMNDAVFEVEWSPLAFEAWTSLGPDQIQFMIQSNKGEAKYPLSKIASGGELSRIMLVIRRIIADRGGIGVYLFDEIDTGVGGQTAFEMGKKLKSVAQYNQVICITHIPQVASFAHHHLSVRKHTDGARTVTEVHTLSVKDRKEELARMLGGATLTKKSLENAAELLEMAR